ncbi:MAG: hypothetical protein M3081_05455 [Gemmatimonadota bacterium]|nr:hypothetical protein [Gemmatimonadota bacterium]
MTEPSFTPRRGAGGTPGGLGTFLFGAGMIVAGGWLLMNHVIVSSGVWQLFGVNAFGLSLLPIIIGIGLLFFDGKSMIGWLLTGAGAVIIFVGIITQLHLFFLPTSLFNTLVMLILITGGIGLVARSLRAQ